MSTRPFALCRSQRHWHAIVAFAATCTVVPALAQEGPAFKPGMWEFSRTLSDAAGKSQTMVTTKCTNPADDLRKRREDGKKAGCESAATQRSGRTYTNTTSCEIRGTPYKSKSVMTVDSDGAYRVDIESHAGGLDTTEKLIAKRTGDC